MICSTIAGIALLSSLASAQSDPAQDKPACGDEIEKFCSHVVPGKLSLAVCLNEKRESLSKECLAKVEKAMVKIEEGQKICGPDISLFCGKVKPGEGRILNCLNANKSDIAPDCRAQVEKFTATSGAPVQSVPEKQPK
jgi:hypothetical protein